MNLDYTLRFHKASSEDTSTPILWPASTDIYTCRPGVMRVSQGAAPGHAQDGLFLPDWGSKLKPKDSKSDGRRVLGLSGLDDFKSYNPPSTTYFIHCRRYLDISEACGRDQESSEVAKDENEGHWTIGMVAGRQNRSVHIPHCEPFPS